MVPGTTRYRFSQFQKQGLTVAAMDIISNGIALRPLRECRSSLHTYVLGIGQCGEKREQLEDFLKPLLEEMKQWFEVDKCQLVVEGVIVQFDSFLCSDMPMLCALLGTKAVFHPQSTYKCLYCVATQVKLTFTLQDDIAETKVCPVRRGALTEPSQEMAPLLPWFSRDHLVFWFL